MLTIAFVTSALALFAAASPAVHLPQEHGLKIALSKRNDFSFDGFVDVEALLASLERTLS